MSSKHTTYQLTGQREMALSDDILPTESCCNPVIIGRYHSISQIQGIAWTGEVIRYV